MCIKYKNLKINFWGMWGVAAVPTAHYTDHIIAHQSGLHFTTCIFYVRTSLHIPKTIFIFQYFIIITVLFYYSTVNFKQKLYDCLNCGMI